MRMELDHNFFNRLRVINDRTCYTSSVITKTLGNPIDSECPIFLVNDQDELGVVVGMNVQNQDILTVRVNGNYRLYDLNTAVFLSSEESAKRECTVTLRDDLMPEIDTIVPKLTAQSNLKNILGSPLWEPLSWNHFTVNVSVADFHDRFQAVMSEWLTWNNLKFSDDVLIEPENHIVSPICYYSRLSRKQDGVGDTNIYRDGNKFVTFTSNKRYSATEISVTFLNVNEADGDPFNYLGTAVSRFIGCGFIPYGVSEIQAFGLIQRYNELFSDDQKRHALANLKDSY